MAEKNWSIRMDEQILEEIKTISEKEMRSINQQMVLFIKKGVEDYKKGEQ